eukprot:TRINITY_DN14396_c0_g1_i1.p1 TRINITY_DN14396_c0_g1~~TRINITY_DN14396_c0_g1_i1.p1  ORF type:complete len:251 (-),score=49.04 TRINITY_DN14396_c0_g1_i1:49-753(-)
MEGDGQLKALCGLFNNEPMRSQLAVWRRQRTFLRTTCKDFWDDNAIEFSRMWLSASTEIRTAAVITALEDLPTLGPLIVVACPELIDPEPLIALSEASESESDSANRGPPSSITHNCKLLKLMAQVCQSKENDADNFDLKTLKRNLGESLTTDTAASRLSGPTSASDAILLVRSCSLLQFVTALQLMGTEMCGGGSDADDDADDSSSSTTTDASNNADNAGTSANGATNNADGS